MDVIINESFAGSKSVNTATSVDAPIRPADLITARPLVRRPERAPNFPAEVAALCELSQAVAIDPRGALRRFLEIALRLCNAGTAGLSLLRLNGVGQATVRWEAISGALASHEGTDTPRDFSPCGLCLDAGRTILVSRPERVFTYLRATGPSIVEDLIVPLYDHAGRPLGTFWIAHHDPAARFCSDDARIVEQLAIQLALALKLLEQGREHRYALALLESNKMAHQNLLAIGLAEERSLREQAEASESAIRQALVFKDAVIQEVHHRVKNTLQIAASLLSLHARATPSAEARVALQESYGRLHLLATVHELLYASADSAQEILMPTLLTAISDGLRQSFAEMSNRVSLQITSDQILLSPDEAIPIALLANEVLTNAYKHAFPDGCAGMIAVNLSCVPESGIILRIMDSGVGMRSSGAESGLGVKLIRSFAAQLQASLVFSKPTDAEGTVVTLRIHRGAKWQALA